MRKGQIRQSELHKREKRREKTNILRIRYLNAKTDEERKAILEKLMKVNPYITIEQFLKPIEKKLNKT
uniref:Phage protein n=1 Tax=candidate division WOR-3 bacterium TaxID=2052148 RepID=A0A7V1EIF6_UNCW3